MQPIEVEDDEIAPSSTSLERSILLDQNAVVECETVEDDDDEEDDLYDLLNIQKRTAKSSDRSKIDSSETTTVGEPVDAIQPRADLTEVPSQSNSHACDECGKNFNRTGNLKRHQEAVHGTVIQSAKNPKGKCTTKQLNCGDEVNVESNFEKLISVFRRNFNHTEANAVRILFCGIR